MSSIVVAGLGKAYKHYPTRWARLAEWLDPRNKPRHQQHWVLKNIDFTVNQGESVGIVGVNGAGKSTLLKMITGTVQPTTGSVRVSGRVAAMLELGMGFHPDFTGLQNVFMSGQMLGYSLEEISRLLPEIIAFAEIGDYIDQPVRVYSSGMQVRLAFAVSTAIRPDVLIVDEALSVGDAAFQRKCFQRIESYLSAGTTLLFVSHDTETVKKLCTRALFIREGHVGLWGSAKQVCEEYERYLFGDGKGSSTKKKFAAPVLETANLGFDPALITSCEMTYGNGKADIQTCWFADTNGQHINIVESGKPFRWCYRVRFNQDISQPIFAMMLKTREGIALYGVDSKQLKIDARNFLAGETVDIIFTLDNYLAPGIYYFNCGVRLHNADGMTFLSRRVDSAILKVTTAESTTVLLGLLEMHAKVELSTSLVVSM
jgi:lipopolysaccharide transport system ATP-binding protein